MAKHRFMGLVLAAASASGGPVAAYDSIKFLPPVKTEEVGRPAALAASDDRLYVLDHKKSAVYIFDAEGKLMKSVGRSGSEKGSFSMPKGVALDPEGRVYVADTGNSRVQILDAEGQTVGLFGTRGSDPGQLRNPEGVAVGRDGRVYVADTGNDRVQVFTKEGVFLFGFGAKGQLPGQFAKPTRLFVDASDFVYVLDSGNERIEKFDPKTKFMKEFNLMGADFALDDYGFFYILDSKAAKVREMGPAGLMAGALGSKGSGPGQFKEPTAIALAPDGDVLVLDPGNARLQRIELTNKLKTAPVAANTDAKLLVSGPKRVIPAVAAALAPGKEGVFFAYHAKEGLFIAYDAEGKPGLKFGTKAAKGDNVTRGSKGFAAAEGGFFVADTDGDKVQHFDPQGEFKAVFAQSTGIFDSKKKEGRVKSPRGVAVSGQGMVYVCNTGNRRVDAFNPDGTFLFSIGPSLGGQELQAPIGVAWDPAGYVYILDQGLKKVFKTEPSGGFLMAWGAAGTGVQEFKLPVSLAFDGKSYVYVLDEDARRVSVFTTSGTWVTNFFGSGSDERSLQSPQALAVVDSQIVVADGGPKGRILVFDLHPVLAPPADAAVTAVQGTVSMQWKRSPDSWAAKYKVTRSSVGPMGPYAALGAAGELELKDSDVSAYKTYWYRVATLSGTGDEGPASAPVEVFVPGAFNRAPIELASVDIGNIYSANYKHYEKNAIGKATLANNVNLPFQNVKVSFRLKDFMDFGTDTVVPELKAEEKVEIPLKAVLNNRILSVTEDTPIQAEFKVTYFEEGKVQEVSLTKPLRVYSRNAITWDKPARIATFVTSNDSPIVDFQKKVANQAKAPPKGASALDEKLVVAMRLWHALGSAGVKFQPAANNPFEKVSEDPAFPVDYTQFPRDTLRLKSGECDDLATLIASLLEQAGVQTALLDYPGHIALMFDTGQSDPLMVGLPEAQLVKHEDTYWIPVEPTLVGSSFSDAHRHAVNAYVQMQKKGKASVIDLDKAVQEFEPATMPEQYEKPDIPKAEDVAKRLEADVADFVKRRFDFARDHLKEELAKDGKNVSAIVQWGILELEQGRLEAASEQFGKALAVDPSDAAALNNLGSVAFMQKNYAKAEEWFLKAASKDPGDPGIWLNLAKCAAKTKSAKLKEYGEKAVTTAGSIGGDVEAEMKTAVGALR